jgi:hypothetical protein
VDTGRLVAPPAAAFAIDETEDHPLCVCKAMFLAFLIGWSMRRNAVLYIDARAVRASIGSREGRRGA